MGDVYTVDTAEVRDHAGNVEDFGARADVAVDAGAHLTSLNDAYGLLCQRFGQMLVEPQERGTEALGKAANLLHQMSGKLNDTADAYDETEKTLVEVIEALLDSLDRAAGGIPTVGGN